MIDSDPMRSILTLMGQGQYIVSKEAVGECL